MYDKRFSQNRRVQGGKTRTFSFLCCFVIIVSAFVTFERASFAQDESRRSSVSLAEGSASIGLNEDVERSSGNRPNLNPDGVFGEQLAGIYPSEEETGAAILVQSRQRLVWTQRNNSVFEDVADHVGVFASARAASDDDVLYPDIRRSHASSSSAWRRAGSVESSDCDVSDFFDLLDYGARLDRRVQRSRRTVFSWRNF